MSDRGSVVNGDVVSFIIPTWNHRKLLFECISSIYDTVDSASCEVVVVDNASTDDSAADTAKNFPDVIWIQNEANLGYARAVNQGVKRATGELLFLLNNDVRLLQGTTEKLVHFLTTTPFAGAVAPLLFYPDGRLQPSCRRFPTPSALLLEGLGIDVAGPFRRWKLSAEEHFSAVMVQQPMASALMVKRECWDAVGPMDEDFAIFFNDVEWCYRLYMNTPYNIYLLPEAKAIHHEGASAKRLGYKRRIELYRGLMRFYCRHFPFRPLR